MVEQGSYILLLEDKNAIWQSTENHVALTAKLWNLLFSWAGIIKLCLCHKEDNSEMM